MWPTPWHEVVIFFETMRAQDLPNLGRHYHAQARFKDPFRSVTGVPAIAEAYRHMFATLVQPHFKVLNVVAQGDEAFLTWDFHFALARSPGQAQCIHGATHLKLDARGLITLHRDYWDAAEELYEKLPVLGGFMRWLKRRAAA